MPPIEEYQEFLSGIWDREYFTNNGPLVQELELRLKNYLGLKNFIYVTNGTIALQIAIQALELKGEIITTPFSYVATTSSIVWEHCTPVYVDIKSNTFNIDEAKIADAITQKTTAILATHVFGNPCEIESIQRIAKKHKLKVIYDAAHCFGTKYKGDSVFAFGDISTASFHATKLFHTVEGGGVFSKSEYLIKKMGYLRNFGHDGPANFNGVGINGKNSELHAAMGLCNLAHIDDVIQKRRRQSQYYDESLNMIDILSMQSINKDADCFNFAYYPIVFETESYLLKAISLLEQNSIFPRRYFYPSLTSLDYVSGHCPISDSISRRVLCLPLYHDLTWEDQDLIISLIKKV
ncbi:MAG: DegT/DnrJ/EryC1/StrS family aminotransferase [Balneola sp.]